MKVVVAGGAGFIGSHLCERLINLGHQVTCIDNLITGLEKNISHLSSSNKFTFLKKDIGEKIDLKTELIYHLASPASPADYIKYPLQTMMANSSGTKNLLDLAKTNKARFVLASTSEVYGDPKISPQSESYWGNVNPIGLRSCYDESKRFSEALTSLYKRQYYIDVVIIRVFNTYGPRMRVNDGRVIPNFVFQAMKNQPLTVYGDGNQTRSFCYIDDMIDGLIAAGESDKASGEVINLGNPNEMTILETAKTIKKICAAGSKLKFCPRPEDDPMQRQPDITKANKILGWYPKINFEKGLEKTVSWFFKEIV
jgi:nucleoside-diphosphate-sugar epimerase